MAGSWVELEGSRVGIEVKMKKRGGDEKDDCEVILVVANGDLGYNHSEKRDHLDLKGKLYERANGDYLTVAVNGELKGEEEEDVEVDIEEEKHNGDYSMVENGELKVDSEGIAGKEGAFVDDKVEEKPEDVDLVEERSNADNCEEIPVERRLNYHNFEQEDVVEVDIEEDKHNVDSSMVDNGELKVESEGIAGNEGAFVDDKVEEKREDVDLVEERSNADNCEEIPVERRLNDHNFEQEDVVEVDIEEDKHNVYSSMVDNGGLKVGSEGIAGNAGDFVEESGDGDDKVEEKREDVDLVEERSNANNYEEVQVEERLNGHNFEQEGVVEVDIKEEKHNGDHSMVENGGLKVENEGVAGKEGAFVEDKIEKKREDVDLVEERSNVENREDVKVDLEEEHNITGVMENNEVGGKEDIVVEENEEPGDRGEEFDVDVDATGKVEKIEKEENLVVEEEKKQMGMDDKDLGSSEVEEKQDMQALIVREEDKETGLPHTEEHAESESQPEEESEDEKTINVEESELSVEVEQKLSFDGDALTNESGGLLENDNTNSAAEISGGSLEYDLNYESINIRFGSFEGPLKLHLAGKELVEEINNSTNYKDVEVELVNTETVPSKSNFDIAFEDKTDNKCMTSSIEEGQCTNKDDEDFGSQATQVAEMIQAPPEARVVKKQFVYMIKVPRIIDNDLQKEIQHAKSIVDEKTQIRDSIGEERRKQLVIVKESSLEYNAELAKEKDARAACMLKRQEFEKVKEKLDKLNNANSIADIDKKIRCLKHQQQHETISLKQEKQCIQEIKRMTRLREQLSLKQAAPEQIDEAFNQRDEVEAQLKKSKKELESLKAVLSSAESNSKSAWNKRVAEQQSLNSLKEKYNAADGDRQQAYQQLTKLRKQSAEKARHFQNYKYARSDVDNYKLSGDNQGLISYCSTQVEGFFDLWNNDKEFRDQYVKSNTHSTLKRLETLDGRSLGMGEERPIFRPYGDKSLSNTESEVSRGSLTEPSTTKQLTRTNQSAKVKSSTKPAFAEDNVHRFSISGKSKEEEERENKHKKEEETARKAEELARKEEELRMEKEAAELKERLRLEQRAKAREAEERKRRKAEKAQARAEHKLQKEAELKEKKKAKAEKKKAGLAVNTANEDIEAPKASIPDTKASQEPETSPIPASKRRYSKHDRVQAPLPPSLRNRSKRKMATWKRALLVLLLVLVVFFVYILI